MPYEREIPTSDMPPTPSVEAPPSEDLFAPFGGMEAWLAEYGQEHGALPGLPGAESWESAIAGLRWSQQYAAETGRAPTQADWERRWQESQGGEWRAWLPEQVPTAWWEQLAAQAQAQAPGVSPVPSPPQAQAPGVSPVPSPPQPTAPTRATPFSTVAQVQEQLAAFKPPAAVAAAPLDAEQELMRARVQRFEATREALLRWSQEATRPQAGAGGVAAPRLEYSVSPGYPAIMDPDYVPLSVSAGQVLTSSLTTGTLPYVTPPGVVRPGLRIPVGKEALFEEMRRALAVRWQELRSGEAQAREYPQAWEASLDIAAATESAVIDWIRETYDVIERARPQGVGGDMPISDAARWTARAVRDLTVRTVADLVWDWPVTVCNALDQVWKASMAKAQVTQTPKDLVRLRELEAMGVSTPEDFKEKWGGELAGYGEWRERGKLVADDYLLLVYATATGNREAMEDIAETDIPFQTWQDIKDWYQMGRLGGTFAKHPETFARYLGDVKQPDFDMDKFITEYEDPSQELLMALLNPINFATPPAVDALLFPAGPLVGAGLKGVFKGAGAVMRKVPVMDWLMALSKQSIFVKGTDEAYDAVACLTLRAEREGISKVDAIGRLMLGDEDLLQHLPESMRPVALELGTRLNAGLGKRGKDISYEELWEWAYPQLKAATEDPTALAAVREGMEPARTVAVAYQRVLRAELGLKPTAPRAERTWRYAGAVLKDNWLSWLGAFHIVNAVGDDTRLILRGIDPFRFPSGLASERAFADYGVAVSAVERTYAEDILERVVGEPGPTARLPVPGFGQPRYVIDALKEWFGFDIAGKGPLSYAARVTTGAQAPFPGTIGEAVGKGWVWLANRANLGSLNDFASDVGRNLELLRRRTSAMQLWERATEGAGGARSKWLPDALASVRALGFSNELSGAVERDLRGVKNPADIRLLADKYMRLPDAPLVFKYLPADEDVPLDAVTSDFITDHLRAADGGLKRDFNGVFDTVREYYETQYKYAVLESLDESNSLYKFFQEYSAAGPGLKPKDLDLLQKLRAAGVESRLKHFTAYDLPAPYIRENLAQVAATGDCPSAFMQAYFTELFPTENLRKAHAADLSRQLAEGKITHTNVMESVTEAYNTMLGDMGVPHRYDYGKVVRLTGTPDMPVPYRRWAQEYAPQGKGFVALFDPSTDKFYGRTDWKTLQDHAAILDAHGVKGKLADMVQVTQDDVTRRVNIRGPRDGAYAAFSDLERLGVPSGTQVDMMFDDPETGAIVQRRLTVGGGEPTVAQEFAGPTEDPLAAAQEAIRQKELKTFARETGAMDYEAQKIADQPVMDDWLLKQREEIARKELTGLVGRKVLTPHGTGTVKEVLEGKFVVTLADGTTVRLPRELISYGSPTLSPQDEATFQSWQAYNEGVRVEWQEYVQQRVDKVVGYLEDWRDDCVAAWGRYDLGERLVGMDREKLQPTLSRLAGSWSELLEKARLRTLAELAETMFDYSQKNNFERHSEVLAPFTTYQFRSIPFFATEAVTNWRVPRFFDLYDRWTELEREKRGLTERFKGTFPVPFQEQLQERGVLPEGYWAMDPKQLMLWQGTVGEPFESPGEEQLKGWLRPARDVATAPEHIGVRYWPWAQIPLEMAGVYGPRETGRQPYQIGGVPSRLFPQVEEGLTRFRGWRPLQAYQEGGARGMWEDLAETMSTPSQENWLRSYYVALELAGMAQQGKLTAEEARAAQYDPTHPAYQEAARRYDTTQRGVSLARLVAPVGLKYASPAELSLRQAGRAGQVRPDVSELWWRAGRATMPEEERRALFEPADRRREYFAELHEVQSERDQRLRGLAVGSREYDLLRRQYNDEVGRVVAKYGDVVEAFETRPGSPEAFARMIQPEQFMAVGGEIDWDAYYKAREDLYEKLAERDGRRGGPARFPSVAEVEKARVKGWAPQRIAGEAHEAWLYGGQKKFFALQPQIDALRKQREEIEKDLTLTLEEQRRQSQLLQDQIDALREQQEGVLEEYGERPLTAYTPYVAERGGLRAPRGQAARLAGLKGVGLSESWLAGKTEEEALERVLQNAFYDQSDATQRQQREALGSDFTAWLSGETTGIPRSQLEDWAAKVPGAKEMLRRTGVSLRRYEPPAEDWWLRARRGLTYGEALPTELPAATPEYEQLYATAAQHMREWRLGERSEWSSEMQGVFGDPESPRSQWFEQVGRVLPYIDWEKLNADRDASAMLSGIAQEDYYAREAAQGFPTLMKYVDQARLAAEPADIRKAADVAQQNWPGVPEALIGAQTEYFAQRTGYDREKWKTTRPEDYKQLQGAWNEQLLFQWENPEYTFIHRPENYHRWWGTIQPAEVRTRLDENVAVSRKALEGMAAYQTAEAAYDVAVAEGKPLPPRGVWTEEMTKVFEDPNKSSVKFYDLYHMLPAGSWGNPIRSIEVIQWIRNPFTLQYVKWEIPDDLWNEAIRQLQGALDNYNANPDPNVPKWQSAEEVDQLWALRDQYFRIRNYEAAYPVEGTFDCVQFARDNALLLRWYPYFDRDWGSRPMDPHTGYGGGGEGAGEGEEGGGGAGPPTW